MSIAETATDRPTGPTGPASPTGPATPGVSAGENPSEFSPEHITIIEPRSGWRVVDWRELVAYRDLFFFLVWRSVKVQYAQSAIGIGWAVIQPLFSMLVFTIIFGRLAQIDSDGAPYAVFSFVALVPWTYFANALTEGSGSLIGNANMLRKVYFPRLILPLSAVFSKLVDFGIAMVLLTAMMAWFGLLPNLGILMLPYLIVLMMLTAGGMGMWLSALAVQYRDIKHGMTFAVQLLMYAAPVVYAASLIPETYNLFGRIEIWPQYLYAMNPMVGVIEGFRSALLGTRPMPWTFILIGSVTATLIALSGAFYFRSRERLFADVA